jgi:hypothetical protein
VITKHLQIASNSPESVPQDRDSAEGCALIERIVACELVAGGAMHSIGIARNTMNKISAFFKSSGTSLGAVFYPTHFVCATFPSYDSAQQTVQSLRAAGFPEDEMLAVDSSELLDFFRESHLQEGAWGDFMGALSRRILQTEMSFCDANIEWAKEGASFIAVHSLTQDEATQIAQVARTFSPLSMQWYRSFIVERLV